MLWLKQNFYNLLYFLTLLVLCIDIIRSNETVFGLIGINSRFIAIWAIMLMGFMRIFLNKRLDNRLNAFNTYVAIPFFLGISIIFTILDFVTPPNFAYSLLPIQYSQTFLVGIFALFVFYFQQTNNWYRKYYSKIIFISFFVLAGLSFIISLFPFEVFRILSHEDSLFENLQFVILLAGSVLALVLSLKIFDKFKTYSILFFLTSLILFAIAGDEISWGQRFLSIATPQAIVDINAQNEITFHNLYSFHGFVGIGYMIIGLIGSIAWLLPRLNKSFEKKPLVYFVPPWFTAPYFFVGFLYNFSTTFFVHPYADWSEFSELILYLGITLTLLNSFLLSKNIKQK